MALATVGSGGRPSARMVLLKGLDARGFVFFTNYESRKAGELETNPWASLLFYWGELERQVRIEGTIERVSEAESAAYFATRPRESQVSAWASPQSRVVADRFVLEGEADRLRSLHEGREIPRPPFWGGYRCLPGILEFWQGRPSRLHDRVRYQRKGNGWVRERVAP
jgi:pyridoxamine 5'-phosphate oxidase